MLPARQTLPVGLVTSFPSVASPCKHTHASNASSTASLLAVRIGPSPCTGAHLACSSGHLALLCRSGDGSALHACKSVTTQVDGLPAVRGGQDGAFTSLMAVCTPWDAGGQQSRRECAAWCSLPTTQAWLLNNSPRPQLWQPPPSLLQPRRCPACQHTAGDDIRSM